MFEATKKALKRERLMNQQNEMTFIFFKFFYTDGDENFFQE
jgi:hypothetical protein